MVYWRPAVIAGVAGLVCSATLALDLILRQPNVEWASILFGLTVLVPPVSFAIVPIFVGLAIGAAVSSHNQPRRPRVFFATLLFVSSTVVVIAGVASIAPHLLWPSGAAAVAVTATTAALASIVAFPTSGR